jgi:GT2 family glycosyltransferase
VIVKFMCVSFNNADCTATLLKSLELQKGRGRLVSVECVVVDNSTSTEDAAICESLTAQYPFATYIRSPRNLGYFGGLNHGLEQSAPEGIAYTVVCNNDLQFAAEFCETLSTKQYDPCVFAICPDVVTADGVHQNPHILNRIGWFRRFQFDLYFSHYYMSRLLTAILRFIRPNRSSPPQPQGSCEVHMGVGACYVLTAEFFRRFKTLRYSFFLYGEEAYIADQIHSAGGRLLFDPDLRVEHAESDALSKVPNRTAYEYARKGYPDYRRLL